MTQSNRAVRNLLRDAVHPGHTNKPHYFHDVNISAQLFETKSMNTYETLRHTVSPICRLVFIIIAMVKFFVSC